MQSTKSRKKKTLDNSTTYTLKKNIYDPVKIGDVTYFSKYTRNLPPCSPDQFNTLVASINECGMKVPVSLDEDNTTIDGWYRILAEEILKNENFPRTILSGLSEEEKYKLAEIFNCNRRQMSPKQLHEYIQINREIVSNLAVKLRCNGQSYRQISNQLGVSPETIRRSINKATVNDKTIKLPSVITGQDGKKRPAIKAHTSITINNSREFERAIKVCREVGSDLPKKSLTLKQAEKQSRNIINNRLRQNDYKDYREGKVELILGDFQTKGLDIESNTVDIIFTDPPYHKKYLSLWDDLGAFAIRVLKPGGLLVTYTGSMYKDQVEFMLQKHLKYLWTGAIVHTGHTKIVHPLNFIHGWKLILFYYKPPQKISWKPFFDIYFDGSEEKDQHDWQQSVAEAYHFISHLCPKKNGVLVDPCMGSATSIIAGLQTGKGLRCIGIDNDKAAYAKAQKRVQEYLDATNDNVA